LPVLGDSRGCRAAVGGAEIVFWPSQRHSRYRRPARTCSIINHGISRQVNLPRAAALAVLGLLGLVAPYVAALAVLGLLGLVAPYVAALALSVCATTTVLGTGAADYLTRRAASSAP
jgi:hypothetical protein